MEHRGKKRVIMICLAVFFAAALAAGIVAENKYYNGLPQVVVGTVVSDNLQAGYSVSGALRHGKETVSYRAEASFGQVTFFPVSGARVQEGQALYQVNADDVALEKLRIELSMEQLKVQDEMSGDDAAGRLQKQINALELGRLEKKLAALEELEAEKCMVLAQRNGVFMASVAELSPVSEGQEVCQVISETRVAYVDWEMPAEAGGLFHEGDEVSALLTVLEWQGQDLVEKDRVCRLVITETQSQGQAVRFTAQIGDDVMLSMDEGKTVMVDLSYVSKVTFEHVIPLSAVYLNEDQKTGTVYQLQERDKVYGKEYYVMPCEVEVRMRAGNYAALENYTGEAQIVIYSDVPLSQGMAVRVE